MLTLTRANAIKGSAGECLPDVFPELLAANVRFRRGQITLIAGSPGGGKSTLALALALRMKIPTLYISCDTDSFTMAHRTAAMLTGSRISEIEDAYDTGNGAFFDEQLDDSGNTVRWVFTPNPTLDELDSEIKAFAIAFGDYPHLLILDNLSNAKVDEDGGTGDYTELEAVLEHLHARARETSACVIALHHLTGEYDNGDKAPPLGALRGKVSKIPECCLTLYRYGQDGFDRQMGVAVVKNRTGKADASGQHVTFIPFDPDRMQLGSKP